MPISKLHITGAITCGLWLKNSSVGPANIYLSKVMRHAHLEYIRADSSSITITVIQDLFNQIDSPTDKLIPVNPENILNRLAGNKIPHVVGKADKIYKANIERYSPDQLRKLNRVERITIQQQPSIVKSRSEERTTHYDDKKI
ncbi:unnamed protein product [Dovyalis caffra]|uniref:Uncharacterized protein n=1 Tax=Dovyalis caffra TaxID=77055 RepID=A0AAV1R9D9_9ROSI|nr:unnamed protein product [Dovyalis caffra]